MAAIYSVTYSVGQTVLAVPLQTGGDQFAPLPFTGATSGVTTTTHYETIAIPVASQSSSQYVVSSAGRNTTLLKAGQGVYTVSVIQPVIALSTTSVTQSAAGLGTTTGAPASGVGSSSISSQAPTSATGNDLVGGSNDQNLGSNDQKPGSNGRNPGSNNIAAIAAAGVMGGLFVIALGALLFLIFKLRKSAKHSVHSPPTMTYGETDSAKYQPTIGRLSASNTQLMSQVEQLEERNTQLQVQLQTLLMRSNSVPPSLDDRSIALRFKQLDRELNDWVIIHFKSTEQRVDLSPELREILISQVPLFDRLLQQPRSRTTVLRAVVGHVIQQAFESGEFVGVDEGLGALERSMGRNTSETEFNKWRSQTFLTLSKASTTESKAQVVATISQRIDNLLSPFSATPNQPERLHFLSRIIESAATLASELGCQLAKFKVLSEPPETPFHSAYMEDVYQEHETQTDPQTGKSVNALDGKIILAVVFPSVVKWGNERGEGYEEMTVLLKTRVLT